MQAKCIRLLTQPLLQALKHPIKALTQRQSGNYPDYKMNIHLEPGSVGIINKPSKIETHE